MQNANWLVIGLGNPGKRYEDTRHNIGFMAVMEFAKRLASSWREERRWPGRVLKATASGANWHLLLPTTYMNNSGQAVRRYLDYFQIPRTQMLVVVDDIALDFGQMRLKEKGSSGGHNGLKSIEAYVVSQEYPRLRMGIGDRGHGELADYVLATFSPQEQEQLPAFLERSADVIAALPNSRFDRLMTAVNARKNSKQETGSQEKKNESRE